MGVSEAQVRKAERVRERAPELDQAVVDGTISVHDAFGLELPRRLGPPCSCSVSHA